jgi:hypothetical protein
VTGKARVTSQAASVELLEFGFSLGDAADVALSVRELFLSTNGNAE